MVNQEGLTMACDVCMGIHSDKCPCCSPQMVMIECPDCGGSGFHYHIFNLATREHTRCTEEVFNDLPYDEDDARDSNTNVCQGDIRTCDTCNGDGVIADI